MLSIVYLAVVRTPLEGQLEVERQQDSSLLYAVHYMHD